MEPSIYFVICVLINLAAAKDTYRAAVVRDVGNSDLSAHIPAIYEAGRQNVDILVLPSSVTHNSKYNYDESVKNVAKAARSSGVYVAAHLHSPRTSLVFNRDGAIVSLYRKPVEACNCSSSAEPVTFGADFGVEFTLLMEEDLALLDPRRLTARNVIVTGLLTGNIPFLTTEQLCGAWSLVARANVLCAGAVHGGHAHAHAHHHLLTIADVSAAGRAEPLPPPVVAPSPHSAGEDLSQYTIKPLDVEASVAGYSDTVCHHKFCCQFYVKANLKESSVWFALGAFSGVRPLSTRQAAGARVCAVRACAGLYKRTCSLGAQNSTDIIFDEISVSGNFSSHVVPFPMIVSSDVITASQFSMTTSPHTTVTIRDASVVSFGIFGRDFSKDHEVVPEREAFADSDSLFSENVQEFIDYVWIRLRILIFVVSIYILEMM